MRTPDDLAKLADDIRKCGISGCYFHVSAGRERLADMVAEYASDWRAEVAALQDDLDRVRRELATLYGSAYSNW